MGTVGDCVPFAGYIASNGYGQVGRSKKAHRVAWSETYGPIPPGMVVRHKCDNPPCVNVAHLELGTKRQNSEDMAARGRSTIGERNPMAVLCDESARQIRCLVALGITGRWVAKAFGVSPMTVSLIKNGKIWARPSRRS